MTPEPRKRKPSLHYVKPIKAPETPQCPPEFIEEIRRRAAEMPNKQSIECTDVHRSSMALWRLAQGMSTLRVSKEMGMDWRTVRALEWRHTDTLETRRKEFSRYYAQAAGAYTDLLMEKAERLADDPEQLDNISPDKLALTVGIMTDKAAQLSGMAGVVIEHRKGASIDDAAKMIAEARERIASRIKSQAIDAEIVNVPAIEITHEDDEE